MHASAASLPGRATVKAVVDTGTMINSAPVVELDLSVAVPGREPYEIKHRQLLARSALPRFQPGAVFSVHVDAADPTTLVIG